MAPATAPRGPDTRVLAELSRASQATGRPTAAERAADVLRRQMIDGDLRPGTQLSEEALTQALGASRNTLREAFRLLAHERLVEHELNRGVFVRRLGPDDVRDIFVLRRLLECGALDAASSTGRPTLPPAVLRLAAEAVEQGRAAAARGDHQGVGTSNMRFHAAIAACAPGRRVQEVMQQVLAELRLVFHEVADPMHFHQGYLARNGELLAMLEKGELARAAVALRAYLDDAEGELVAAAGDDARADGSAGKR